MAAYVCKKCGIRATSKCVLNRSILTPRLDSVYSHLLKSSIESEPVSGVKTITLKIKRYEPGATDEAFILGALMLIKEMTVEDIKIYSCGKHDLVLLSDFCDLGCCTKGNT